MQPSEAISKCAADVNFEHPILEELKKMSTTDLLILLRIVNGACIVLTKPQYIRNEKR